VHADEKLTAFLELERVTQGDTVKIKTAQDSGCGVPSVGAAVETA
jgi:hypothetical protein